MSIFELITLSLPLVAVFSHGMLLANQIIEADEQALFGVSSETLGWNLLKAMSYMAFAICSAVWMWNKFYFRWF